MAKREYLAYLLRMWRDRADGPWRATLEDPHQREKVGFSSIKELITYLQSLTGIQGEDVESDQGCETLE